MAPQYLPPQSTMKPPATTMKIDNRFAYDNDDEESRPIWPNSKQERPAAPTVRPVPAGKIPTRLPKGKLTTETPLLFHKGDKTRVPQNSIDTSRKETDAAIDSIFGKEDGYRTTPAPAPAATTTTTTTRKEGLLGPGDCVWAVVSCCSAGSTNVADACFEQRGCPGPFWGTSPCDSQFARDAIKAALEYYG